MRDQDLATIAALLCRHLGLEVSSIGSASLVAAVKERVRACNVPLAQYALHVEHSRAELDALVDAIVVPESWFFRDRVPFEHLAIHARGIIRKGRRVRVLSAPCSTGEEPYSVAMTLVDAGIEPGAIAIDAVDVSPELIARARAGVYRASSFRGVDVRFRDAYFMPGPESGTWVLADPLRRMVRFRAMNLLAHDALAGEAPYDIILCRNLLIYLTSEARAKVLGGFIRVLGDGGILVVGHAESLEVIDRRFQNVGVAGAFTYTLRTQDAPATVVQPVQPPPRRLTPVPRPVERRPSEPIQPLATPATPRDILAEANTLANRGQLADAAALIEQHLAEAGGDANGWALLGTVRQASGDLTRAEDCFSRAVYCDPGMYTALVQLALLLEKRGETRSAQQMRARAERAKSGRPR